MPRLRRRRLREGAIAVVATLGALLLAGPGRAGAAPRDPGPRGVGYDLAGPQCDAPYPGVHAFGIVGVNGGLANNENPCLGGELAWASTSPGLHRPAQPPVSLYVNTADPGPTRGVRDWPRSGTTPSSGRCRGGWSTACAYLYGRARAEFSFGLVRLADPAVAVSTRWWLDVETSSSWATLRRRDYRALNLAAIHGFMAGLHASGVRQRVGVYSFAADWKQLTGLSPRDTAAAFGSIAPPAWVGGTRSRQHASGECRVPAFTGTRPLLVQFRAGRFDGDLRCPS